MRRFREDRNVKEGQVKKQLPLEYFNKEKEVFNEKRREKALRETLKSGDIFPSFLLSNMNESPRTLEELMGNFKYLVISFQRGEWCPFCNLELKHLQKRLDDYHQLDANVVSIVPRSKPQMQEVIDIYNLEYEIMYDAEMQVARKLGITFELPDFMASVYEKLGMDSEYLNGRGNYEVPVPATFVIDRNMVIKQHFIDLNYMRRLDPDRILNYLRSIDNLESQNNVINGVSSNSIV